MNVSIPFLRLRNATSEIGAEVAASAL